MERAIRQAMGTRYKAGGTDRHGMDCSGFTWTVFRSANIELPRTAEQQYGAGRSVGKDDLQFGDLVFFNTKAGAESPVASLAVRFCPTADLPWAYGITHTGIYTGRGRFAHASPSKGVSYARLEDDYWRARYVGARRVMPDSGQPDE